MSIYLRNRISEGWPVDVRTICPELFRVDDPTARIANQKIRYGNLDVEFGELFDVTRSGTTPDIVWQGELASVHHIGSQLDGLTMRIEGNAGRHVGAGIRSGEIIVEGDASDFLGSQMRGGTIRVKGNTGDLVGGCLAGESEGMNRGNILIGGNAGAGVGHGMRRGLIAIKGNVGRGLGWKMLAGTIVVFGSCHDPVGNDMRRGTIVLAGGRPINLTKPIPANYRYVGRSEPPVVSIISRWMLGHGFDFPNQKLESCVFDQFAVDQLQGGRGELFCHIDDS